MISNRKKIITGLIFLVSKDVVCCESPSYRSKVVENVIEVTVNSDDSPNFFHIAIPYKLKGLVFKYAALKNGCQDDMDSFTAIPLSLKKNGELMETQVFMNSIKAKDWRVHVTYLKERNNKEEIRVDGPAIESWTALKHNKVKNEKASEAGPLARR